MNNVIIINKIKMDEYKIHKTYNAGIVLMPKEVKDILQGSCSLKGSYGFQVEKNFCILKMYLPSTEYRNRVLLLNKKEIIRINSLISEGKTIIPKSIFKVNNLIKLELIVCNKLKKYENKKQQVYRSIDKKEARMYKSIKIVI